MAQDLGRDQARRLVADARLIKRLSTDEFASASQIARVLGGLDRRPTNTWRAIKLVLEALGVYRGLDVPAISATLAQDHEFEPTTFGDADISVASDLVVRLAKELGFPFDIGIVLNRLTEGSPDFPYLSIAHFQTVICDHFDHPPSWLYEFEPRGLKAEEVFRLYHGHVPTANPFLNNAKSVARLDRAWAETKADRLPRAHALADLLMGLDDMGFLARKQLCGMLRQWFLRVVRLTAAPSVDVVPMTLARAMRSTQGVASKATATVGILEQRLVEGLGAVTIYKASDGWRHRGIGDAVNASNLSRKKVGDCEFQDATARRIVALEPTAGRLSQIYVDAHRRTLERVLAARAEELEAVAQLSSWTVEVVFVAHEFAATIPAPEEIEGVSVSYRFEYFSSLIGLASDDERLQLTNDFVVPALSRRQTPDFVRTRFNELADGL